MGDLDERRREEELDEAREDREEAGAGAQARLLGAKKRLLVAAIVDLLLLAVHEYDRPILEQVYNILISLL